MFKALKEKSGLILTETLLAVTLLATAAIVMGAIITNAVSANRISREYLLAHNLTSEAIEAMKNVRSTNWLMEPLDSSCWVRLDTSLDCNQLLVAGKDYIPVEASPGVWKIESSGSEPLDLNDDFVNNGGYQLYSEKVTGGSVDYLKFGYDDAAGNEPSRFYRGITINELDQAAGILRFTVSLQWMSESKVRRIDRETVLYNYR